MTREKQIEYFKGCLMATGREGVEDLLDFIEELGFYDAPASGGNHCCKDGGLLEHTVNVMQYAEKIGLTLLGSEAYNKITNMMKYPDANTLVVRKTYRTLKDSCFTELKWAIHRLGVDAFWDIKESPLEMTYKPTGQKIYFRGLDDPLKVTSITVDQGVLCWMWIEEAYEISSEDDFNMLDESIRGAIPEGSDLFKQITVTFNPWNEHHWLKKRFFDNPDDETLALTTNYKCNEWLDKADLKVFETMRKQNPRRYAVAGLGDWGIVDGLV